MLLGLYRIWVPSLSGTELLTSATAPVTACEELCGCSVSPETNQVSLLSSHRACFQGPLHGAG